MRYHKKILLFAILMFIKGLAIAQNGEAALAEKEDLMRSGGKIYVVMAVVITILTGLIVYISRLDKKISNLEKGGNS